MPNPFLNNNARLLFAKTLHDLAAPLGALNLCIDDLKKALPESAELIENSVETLNKRINYWRMMTSGGENFPNFADAAEAIRVLAKIKGIVVTSSPAMEYQGVYVRLLLAMAMVAIESLAREGKISIDADNGLVTAEGPKCFIHKETQEAIAGTAATLSSRHALGLLIWDWAKVCNAVVKLNHTPTKLVLALQVE